MFQFCRINSSPAVPVFDAWALLKKSAFSARERAAAAGAKRPRLPARASGAGRCAASTPIPSTTLYIFVIPSNLAPCACIMLEVKHDLCYKLVCSYYCSRQTTHSGRTAGQGRQGDPGGELPALAVTWSQALTMARRMRSTMRMQMQQLQFLKRISHSFRSASYRPTDSFDVSILGRCVQPSLWRIQLFNDCV